MRGYEVLSSRVGSIEEAKKLILSYKPGEWIDKVGSMRTKDYDVPKTVSLVLIGPRGSGKSTLVNRISRILDTEKMMLDRAQVSYNSSSEDGTCFLQEYKVPRGSNSICLYDTRSLSESSSENFEMIKRWMEKGVRHGEAVFRDSDNASMRKSIICRAWQAGFCFCEPRRVNFVIFVINGISVLKSIDGVDDAQSMRLLAETFRCPYLSFKDNKPVVVITHGDLLSQSDRARVRIHLGESLGIPPATQIFDIPDNCDLETEVSALDMLRYSLMRAERNLRQKNFWSSDKVLVLLILILICVLLIPLWKVSPGLDKRIQYMHRNIVNHIKCSSWSPRRDSCTLDIDWRKIRHIWSG
ncbi:hypothetical protein Syun_006246 [Stephania yunnanensis]|uniref:G domain-containing protein n=1 Tax=Stephania yunnanensis TaxID=152371 RepID=A0AAP0KX98_9MAGN